MKRPIVVVGSINMDMVYTSRRQPKPGETVFGTSLNFFPGGKGANQAVAAAKLYGHVRLIGMLGDDSFAQPLRLSLVSAGVDISCVGVAQGSSGTAIIAADPEGQNAITVIPGANAHLLPERIDEFAAEIQNAGIVLAQLEVPLETVMRAAEIAAEAGVPFMLDPAPACLLPERLLNKVSWITPNETEAEELIGEGTPAMTPGERATALLNKGAKGVVLKRGPKGVFLSSGDAESIAIPAPSVTVVDTTAAGDAFNGAFAAALIGHLPVEQAARYAVAAATVSVTRHGAQPSLPSKSEVMAMLAANLS